MRHGQTDWNVLGRIQGHSDIPLNDEGQRQAREAVDRIAGLGVTRLVCSDLSRAQDTARPAAHRLKLPITTDARLRERCFGVLEGLTWAEVEAHHPELHARLQQDRAHPVPGAETLELLQARMVSAVQDILAQGPGALLVTHGGSVRSLMRAVPGGGLPGPILNAGTYCFDEEDGQFIRVMLV